MRSEPPQWPPYPHVSAPSSPAPQQPPKHAHPTRWRILALVVVVLVVGGLFAVIKGINQRSMQSLTQSIQSTQTAAVTRGQIGQTVNYHQHWQITITGVTTSSGNPAQLDATPAPGTTYLVLAGMFENLQATTQLLFTFGDFPLHDPRGTLYHQAELLSLKDPDGDIPPGGVSAGQWGYRVPTSQQHYTLTFTDDLAQTSVLWEITLP